MPDDVVNNAKALDKVYELLLFSRTSADMIPLAVDRGAVHRSQGRYAVDGSHYQIRLNAQSSQGQPNVDHGSGAHST